ncbi:nuclear transport factor 2 [Echinococcus multilocularis]|uniref:Nuclear transport factor 2 n=2 Tax=Echinococcus TaxID=6209 RepID=U6J4J0_ECHGR|nr:Nuclear transport factor 2 [Echinococcus granulosus]EUB60535.1 Nuclear transport factor 2 [Echinococcus granulosus]CDS18251.1 nuclear transport factor 2 [Echinococcus granulosus]CUT98954.1 nuclear transport factor 2 [Echinococcus multilocularis]
MDAYFAAFPNDFDTLGEVFVKTYYEQLQLNRNNVDMALMTYEGTKIQGKQAIAKHFQGLCWTTIAVNVSTCDCQPVDNGYLVFVNGQLKVDNGEQALPFSEFFLLKKVGDRVVILHSMFRLHFHNF